MKVTAVCPIILLQVKLLACVIQSTTAFVENDLISKTVQNLKLGKNGISHVYRRYQIYINNRHCSILTASSSKWDNLQIDDDDEDDTNALKSYVVPPDMHYNARNALRQNRQFVAIQDAGGTVNDVYARVSPNNQRRDSQDKDDADVFWYIGKVARVSGVSLEACIARQWNLIELHAAFLRPLELFPHRDRMELWTAPGDSELQVAYNNPDIVFTQMNRNVTDAERLKVSFVGFQGEVYDRGEEGFRTWRRNDGRPARPEIRGPASDENDDDTNGGVQAPTNEEMERLEEALKGRNINEVYEELQKRRKNENL